MPIRVKQADGSYKVASIKQKTPEEYEWEIHFLEQGRKEYVKDAVKRMQQLQRQIDILYEFVRDKDLEEIQRRFEEICAICSKPAITGEDGNAICERCLDDCKARIMTREAWEAEFGQFYKQTLPHRTLDDLYEDYVKTWNDPEAEDS